MKREFLKNLGIADELIDGIMAEAGKERNEYITKVNELTTKNSELTSQLDSFKDYDTIKAQLESTKAEFETYKTTSASELEKNSQALNSLKLSHSIDMAVEREHSIDSKAFMAHLDTSKISLDENGSLVGYEEQSKAIHENQAYLFATTKPTGLPSGTLGGSQQPMTMLDAIKDHYSK